MKIWAPKEILKAADLNGNFAELKNWMASLVASKADNTALAKKADLDATGKVPLAQLPDTLATDSEVSAAIAAATSGLATGGDLTAGLATKADVQAVNTGLASKADAATTTAVLAKKADLNTNGVVPDSELPSNIVRATDLATALANIDLSKKADLNASGIVPYSELPPDLVKQADMETALAHIASGPATSPRPPLSAFTQSGWRAGSVLADGVPGVGPLRLINPSPSSGGFFAGLLKVSRDFGGSAFYWKPGGDFYLVASVRARIPANCGSIGICLFGPSGNFSGCGANSNGIIHVLGGNSETSGSIGNDSDNGKLPNSAAWVGGVYWLRISYHVSTNTWANDYSYDGVHWAQMWASDASYVLGPNTYPVGYGLCLLNGRGGTWADADVFTFDPIPDPTGVYNRNIAS
ncbi:conserved protein of unknown function (plasmid) [Rhodovastum atsumiense]|uniref:Uncharacterized protein n=1 Tax=Rhodovastum atsumiense TaxID=504468 RepID=A0A5M6IVL3_9PROT|nr:hypothetical protein [Rhodovastum atsumiense]KAA5611887.1 hypothetical protein F1189_12710 [Rhodovastum atsumiense]CAH2606134.1 conserved protein of unknown function [Rhodovastum atsumiense]